jgi:hypothetical protein
MRVGCLGVTRHPCPAGMGLMTWMMLRTERPHNSGAAIPVGRVDEAIFQVEALRTEVEQLKVERIAAPADSPRWM